MSRQWKSFIGNEDLLYKHPSYPSYLLWEKFSSIPDTETDMEKISLLNKKIWKTVDGVYRIFFQILIVMLMFECFYAYSNVTFERNPTEYSVFKGYPVFLMCDLETTDPLSIAHKEVVIVENSHLRGSSSKYTLLPSTSSNAYTLKIHQAEKNDGGIYFCRAGILNIKELKLVVYYWPNREPVCASSLQFSTIFFEDMLNEEFHFNCTVEDGNPMSEAIISMETGKGDRFELDYVVTESEENIYRRTLSFSSVLNSTFNSSKFICEVRQQMPPSLEKYNYKQDCPFGPLTFLKNFETLVSPSNVSIKQGNSVSLMCSSNVRNAEKRWMTNFSDDVKWEIKKMENDINLTLSVIEGYDTNVIMVVCESFFGQRNSSAVGQIYITPEKPKHFPTILVVLLVLVLLTGTLGLICVVKKRLLKSGTLSSDVMADGDGENMERMVAS